MSIPRIELGLQPPQSRVLTIILYGLIISAKDGLEPPIFPQKIGTLYPLSYLAFSKIHLPLFLGHDWI
tara:strand:+ start:232 stop:435 length:204 start_codon:yes stop_codon:yes gene_type:complete